MDAIADDVVVAYRGVEPGDLHFILNSWMKSFKPTKKGMRADMYYAGQQRLIAALADKSPLIICCDGKPGQSNFIYGWVCGQMNTDANVLTLHYIYVKQGYRAVGLGKDLLKQIGWKPMCEIHATHWTTVCGALAQRYNVYPNDYPLMIGNQHV